MVGRVCIPLMSSFRVIAMANTVALQTENEFRRRKIFLKMLKKHTKDVENRVQMYVTLHEARTQRAEICNLFQALNSELFEQLINDWHFPLFAALKRGETYCFLNGKSIDLSS